MAGGMDRRPFRSASLAERSRRSGVSAGTDAALPGVGGGQAPPISPTAATAGPAPAAGGGPTGTSGTSGTSSARRHCWVSDATASEHRAAGLLVEWRQRGGTWQGRVAYVVDVDGQATLVEAWLPASQLERAAETR